MRSTSRSNYTEPTRRPAAIPLWNLAPFAILPPKSGGGGGPRAPQAKGPADRTGREDGGSGSEP